MKRQQLVARGKGLRQATTTSDCCRRGSPPTVLRDKTKKPRPRDKEKLYITSTPSPPGEPPHGMGYPSPRPPPSPPRPPRSLLSHQRLLPVAAVPAGLHEAVEADAVGFDAILLRHLLQQPKHLPPLPRVGAHGHDRVVNHDVELYPAAAAAAAVANLVLTASNQSAGGGVRRRVGPGAPRGGHRTGVKRGTTCAPLSHVRYGRRDGGRAGKPTRLFEAKGKGKTNRRIPPPLVSSSHRTGGVTNPVSEVARFLSACTSPPRST